MIEDADSRLWMKCLVKNVDSSFGLIIQAEQVCSHYEFFIMTNRSTLEIEALEQNYILRGGRNSSSMALCNQNTAVCVKNTELDFVLCKNNRCVWYIYIYILL